MTGPERVTVESPRELSRLAIKNWVFWDWRPNVTRAVLAIPARAATSASIRKSLESGARVDSNRPLDVKVRAVGDFRTS